MRIFRLLLVVVLLGPLLLQPRAASSAQSPPEVVVKTTTTPWVPITSMEGKANYDAYCAACHGRDARGNGPAASAFKNRVPDLTRLVAPSGKFSSLDVLNSVTGNRRPAAHGTLDMPTWGPVFTSVEAREVSKLRIYNLTKYIESIQQH